MTNSTGDGGGHWPFDQTKGGPAAGPSGTGTGPGTGPNAAPGTGTSTPPDAGHGFGQGFGSGAGPRDEHGAPGGPISRMRHTAVGSPVVGAGEASWLALPGRAGDIVLPHAT